VFQDDQKRWFARLTYTDPAGQRPNLKRHAANKTAAKEALKQLIRDLEDYGERSIESAQLTFTELAAYYAERYLKPAEYREGRKIAGLRSVRYCALYLRTLKEHFGNRKLRNITYGDLKAFKLQCLESQTVRGQNRSLANVHRTLALLRHLFNIAVREG
jgi:hypothetical protein